MTSNVSVTVPAPFSATRRTLRSSSIRLVLVWSRPAVSAITRSQLRAAARSTASNTTEEGSAPSAPRTMSTPLRSAHIVSCSAAAARKVSPAASTIVWPSLVSRAASFPMVVVFPTPLTPTNNQTAGPGSPPAAVGSLESERSKSRSRDAISCFTRASSAAESSTPVSATRACTASMISVAVRTPTSARISASSRSSQVRASMAPRENTDPR